MDGLSVVQHRSPCDGRPEGLDRFGPEETGCHQCPAFPLHPRLRRVPVLHAVGSCEVRLGEHECVDTKFLIVNDFLSEGLLLLLVVEAPHVREENAKLQRGLTFSVCDLLNRLLIVYLLLMMT